MTATVAALAAALVAGAPAPILHSQGEHLRAAHGSSCWTYPPDENGVSEAICSDTLPPVTKRSLPVRRGGRVRIDMRIPTDKLHAHLRGRTRALHVNRKSKRAFVVRLPRHMKRRPVLDLLGRYPQGDASFGARLRVRRAS